MRSTLFIFLLILFSCNKKTDTVAEKSDTLVPGDSVQIVVPKPEKVKAQKFANERFREVAVEKMGNQQFHVTGEAQVFEANLSWVIKKGNTELKEGFAMTDAGAPAWGKFDFIVTIEKTDENSNLRLILFESSAKDGSRQFELPIIIN